MYNYKRRKKINPFYYSDEWRALRKATLKRDGGVCQYCGLKAKQADHVLPRRKGGKDSLDNLVACCQSCNKVAGGKVFLDFFEKKTYVLSQRKMRKSTS